MHESDIRRVARGNRALRLSWLLAAPLTAMIWTTGAGAQIDRPGAHPKYSVELEPHGLVQWDVHPADEGFGAGLRLSIPVIPNGPVTTINNSLAVAFGFDWAHSPDDCEGDFDCHADNFELPVVAQWNFFFSDSISLLAELGLDIRYETWGNEAIRPYHHDNDDIEAYPQFLLGVRFTVGKNITVPIRIGWPYLSVGVSFLL